MAFRKMETEYAYLGGHAYLGGPKLLVVFVEGAVVMKVEV
jgi:hypothetical protein